MHHGGPILHRESDLLIRTLVEGSAIRSDPREGESYCHRYREPTSRQEPFSTGVLALFGVSLRTSSNISPVIDACHSETIIQVIYDDVQDDAEHVTVKKEAEATKFPGRN